MVHPRQCSKIALVPGVALLAFAAFALAAEGPDFDQLMASGQQLVKNGSFEEMDRGGDFAEGWGLPKDVKDNGKVVTDAKRSKHGSVFLTFDMPEPRFLYGSLTERPKGRTILGFWVRGHGDVMLRADFRDKDWKQRPKDELNVFDSHSKVQKIASEDWVLHQYEIDVPESFERNGEKREAGILIYSIRVNGKIDIDECFAYCPDKVGAGASAEKKTPVANSASENAGNPVDFPRVTVPKLAKAPTLDGQLAEGEWAGAAAVTGMNQLGLRAIADRQATYYVGYDDQRLYIAFVAPHKGKVIEGPPEQGGRGKTYANADAVEVWLVRPDGEWFQIFAVPSGGYMDISKSQSHDWVSHWNYASKVRDLEEMIGGIASFEKKIWTGELSIAWKDLGATAPKDGETWRLNFTRDYTVPEGALRKSQEWTTWSPIQGRFNEPDQFGFATFRSDAPAFQMKAIGDLINGDARVKGQIGGEGTVVVSAKITPVDSDKTIAFKSDKVQASPGGKDFELTDTLRVRGASDLALNISAVEQETGQSLYEARVAFTAMAALRAELYPVYDFDAKDKCVVNVEVDATRVADLPRKVHLLCELHRDGSPAGLKTEGSGASGDPLTAALAIPSGDRYAPGEYEVKIKLLDKPNGQALASTLARFTLAPKPEWWGMGRTDISDVVPRPYTPVEIDGNKVRVIQREYRLGPLGLPTQAIATGEELFAAPPTLRAVVGGKELQWEGQTPELIERHKGVARWRLASTAGPLTFEGTLSIEFDGFALLDFVIDAAKPVEIEALSLDFPFKKERSLYARGQDGMDDRSTVYNCLLDESGPEKVERPANSYMSYNGWVWPDQWVHMMFLGDDFRGFEVMSESHRNLSGKRRTEVIRTPRANTLRLTLIDGARKIDGPVDFQTMWQATPVRPRPDDAKKWRACYSHRIDFDKNEKSGLEKYVLCNTWSQKWTSYPKYMHSAKAFEAQNSHLQAAGVKVVPYAGTGLLTIEVPDLLPFMKSWEVWPSRSGSSPQGMYVIVDMNNPALRDYYLWYLKQTVETLGFDGLYLDVSREIRNTNHYAGSGWYDESAREWRPTVNLLGTREIYKRMWIYNKSDGRDAVLFYHNMPPAAFAGFVDVVTQGEDWCWEGNNQYDELTPEVFRAKEMRIQYGTPFTWYSFHHYYRGERFGGRTPLYTILAYMLPHRVIHTPRRIDHLLPIWEVTDPFWPSADFIPYWSPDSPVTTGDPAVLGSVWLKGDEQRALLVVSNWDKEPKKVKIKIDVAKMGLDPARVVARRVVDHPILSVDDTATDPMKNGPIAIKDGSIALDLGGRNLEILTIEEK